MTLGPSIPRKLDRTDETSSFRSGAIELDEWLDRYAWENLRANNAITYVSTIGTEVVGYYAIAVGAVAKDVAPTRLAKGAPREVPCIILARLAVHSDQTGKGIGAALLKDALERAAQISEAVGARAVLIHARDESAKAFYLRNADCLESPLDNLQLMLPMKDIVKLFR